MVCELWPSRIRSQYPFVLFLAAVLGLKSLWSHAEPNSWSVQPFGETEMLHNDDVSLLCKEPEDMCSTYLALHGLFLAQSGSQHTALKMTDR